MCGAGTAMCASKRPNLQVAVPVHFGCTTLKIHLKWVVEIGGFKFEFEKVKKRTAPGYIFWIDFEIAPNSKSKFCPSE